MVLFDAGNTLVFLDEVAVAKVAATVAEPLSPPRIRAAQVAAKRDYAAALAAGLGHGDAWLVYVRTLCADAGAAEAALGALVATLQREHARLNLWRRVPEDLPRALDRLTARGVRLGVVSNSEGAVADILEHTGLLPRLELVVDSGVEGVAKPDPEIFRRALCRMGVEPSEAVYVGDLPDVDIEGARNAGLGAVLVDAYDEHRGYDAAPRVRSVAELVGRWLGGG